MDAKKYILDFFEFNSQANKQVFGRMASLTDDREMMRLASHLVNCQYKWMARIMQDPGVQNMDWWMPLYTPENLLEKWEDSLAVWRSFIEASSEESLFTEVHFPGFDGTAYAATPYDIALQLNYHAIHHRAQMQSIIRQQGFTPDFIDYIGTKYRKL